MTNPYLQPAPTAWTRIAGIALLLAGTLLTVYLAHALFVYASHEELRRQLTSSTVIFGLVLLALCGFCWQAGFRFARNRPGPTGTLFARPTWFAMGTGLLVMAVLMAFAIVSARRPGGSDVVVVVTLAALGAWCIVLACRPRIERSGTK